MKIKNVLLTIFLIGSLLQAQVQDTLVIEQADALNITTIINDNPDKVYKLRRGVRYFLNGVIESGDWHLKIIGEAGPTDLRPATLQPKVDEGANAPDFGIVANGDVTIKNIYFLNEPVGGREARGGINARGNKKRIEVDNCIFDYGFHIAIRNDGSLSSYFITNSLFKNIAFWNNISNGKAFSIRQVDIGLDSLVIENCTFSNMNNLMSGWGGNVKYYKFNLNTAFNIIKLPNEISQHCLEAEITNNIFYNVAVIGHAENPAPGGASWINYYGENDTTQLKNGFLFIQKEIRPDTIFAEDGTTVEFIFENKNRTIKWTNNNVYFSDEVTSFWEADTNYDSQPFMNDSVAAMVANNDNYVVEAPLSIDPEFTILPNTIDSLILKVLQATDGILPQTDIYYLPTDPNGLQPWPIELDFSYPETGKLYTAATDGGPIGDRRWFPDYVVSVENKNNNIIDNYKLSQNYPNPFNPTTVINYQLPEASNVKIKIFNVLGKEVTTLVNEKKTAGQYSVKLNAANLASGVYFYSISAGSYYQIKKMMLLK